ncbi:MAG: hypothetical protein OXF45_06395 [Candidatus Dadabacteria bacterium]|nr:hypothetical protein [Candidatus Dadabacteria bacterium]
MLPSTFPAAIKQQVSERGSALLIQRRDGMSWKQITWKDFETDAESMAAFLASGGFCAGDPAFFSPGGAYPRLVAETAVLMLGGVSVSGAPPAGAKAAFVKDREAAEAAGADTAVYFSGAAAPDGKTAGFEAAVKFGFMRRKKTRDQIREAISSVRPEQAAFDIRDGGGAGVRTHGEFMAMLSEAAEHAGGALGAESQCYCHLPGADIFSRVAGFLPLFVSARWAAAEGRDEFFADILEVMPTVALVDAETVEMIARGDGGFQGFGGRLAHILTGRAPQTDGFFTRLGVEVRELPVAPAGRKT